MCEGERCPALSSEQGIFLLGEGAVCIEGKFNKLPWREWETLTAAFLRKNAWCLSRHFPVVEKSPRDAWNDYFLGIFEDLHEKPLWRQTLSRMEERPGLDGCLYFAGNVQWGEIQSLPPGIVALPLADEDVLESREEVLWDCWMKELGFPQIRCPQAFLEHWRKGKLSLDPWIVVPPLLPAFGAWLQKRLAGEPAFQRMFWEEMPPFPLNQVIARARLVLGEAFFLQSQF